MLVGYAMASTQHKNGQFSPQAMRVFGHFDYKIINLNFVDKTTWLIKLQQILGTAMLLYLSSYFMARQGKSQVSLMSNTNVYQRCLFSSNERHRHDTRILLARLPDYSFF